MNFLKTVFTAIILMLSMNASGQRIHFNNPIAEKRADPWVHKTDDGMYHLIATVPEYDRIVIRKATIINGLKAAKEQVVWSKHVAGNLAANIWAPELHKIDGVWYIYFAAGTSEDAFDIRMWVLSNGSARPMEGEWKEEGRIITKMESFSLDATVFEHKCKHYLLWAQNVFEDGHGTGLVLSEMKSPTELRGPEVIITKPEFNWEKVKYDVNEGPAVLIKNGKIFVTYSASATNHNYCVGLLWIDENEDLLHVSNWHKSPGPVFYTNADVMRFGPGHNCFTTSEDGETVMIYHARNYKEIQGHELDDPNRDTRARVVNWTPSGFPDFMQKMGD